MKKTILILAMILFIAISVNAQNITGSGTANYLPLFTNTTVVGNSGFYQNGSGYIGIGTGTTVYKLFQINNTAGSGNNHLFITGTNPAVAFSNALNGTELTTIGLSTGTGQFVSTSVANDFIFRTINNSTGNFIFAIGTGATPAEIMRITYTGNVGIGTTTIGSKLQVNGNAAIGYSASTAAPSNGLCVNGNVGIGLSAPTDKLSVTDTRTTTGCTAILGLSTGANVATGYAGYFSKTGASVTNVGGYFSASGATNNYGIIVASGIVGIGTTAPSSTSLLSVGSTSQFQVNSTGGITSSGSIIFSSFTSNGGPLFTNGSGTLSQVAAGTATTVLHGGTTPSFSAVSLANDITGILTVGHGGTGASTFTAGILYGNGTSAITSFPVGTANYIAKWGSSPNFLATSLIYDNGTKVGIGTASPSQKLTVTGSGRIADSLYLNKILLGTSDSVLVRENNVVKYKLLTGNSWSLTGNAAAVSNFVGTTNYISMRFRTNNTQRMIIDSVGNIGIGTSKPTDKLTVTGNAKINGNLTVNGTLNGTYNTLDSMHILNNIEVGNSIFISGNNLGDGYNAIYTDDANISSVDPTLYIQSLSAYPNNTIINSNNDGRVGIGTNSPDPNCKFMVRTGINKNLSIKNFWDDTDHNITISALTDDYSSHIPLYFAASSFYFHSGNVGIGTTIFTNGTDQNYYKLAVNGSIHAKDVVVDLLHWPDFVFEKDYKLKSLSEVAQYISKNKHLPDVPSATEIEKNGVSLGSSNALLLQKIEELTLYIIDLQKQIDDLKTTK